MQTLILTVSQDVTQEDAERVREEIRKVNPDLDVIMIWGATSATVIDTPLVRDQVIQAAEDCESCRLDHAAYHVR